MHDPPQLSPAGSSALLSMRGIGKRFPGVVALSQVDLHVSRGEVVALCGENGAGKSTLMKILGGIHQPDLGEIRFDGHTVAISNVYDAMRLGIALIHQELNVLLNLDLAANVYLGREPRIARFLIDRAKIHADTAPYLRRLGLHASTHVRLGNLSLAQQQLVEIAKALSQQARLIIMDEPTSSLTLHETDRLLSLVRELAGQGVSVIYISHRLGEVVRVADRVVILRDGKNAGELSRGEITHDRIVERMVGREILSSYVPSSAPLTPGYLQVRNACSSAYPAHRVSFDAAGGQILGVAGLVGAGRSEIAKAIVGLDRHGVAEVTLDGRRTVIRSPRDALSIGLYLVPEDRRGEGLVVEMSVRENLSLPSLPALSRWGLIDRARERQLAGELTQALSIKAASSETLVQTLSGGNQQKVVLGKWLARGPKVLILDEPTRGIDVQGRAEIYRRMRALADQGAAIVMISSEMEELLNVADRVLVMHEGQLTGLLDRADCTEENIMQLAVGKHVAAAHSPSPIERGPS